jgi:hypothetical protein
MICGKLAHACCTIIVVVLIHQLILVVIFLVVSCQLAIEADRVLGLILSIGEQVLAGSSRLLLTELAGEVGVGGGV